MLSYYSQSLRSSSSSSPALRLPSLALLLLSTLLVMLSFPGDFASFALAAPAGGAGTGNRDFYKILELQRSATEAQIKKAYRKLSMKYHPDKNGGAKDAADKFQDVAAAYEALSNKDTRRIYDQVRFLHLLMHNSKA